jgi:thiamine-monophosphate kinase
MVGDAAARADAAGGGNRPGVAVVLVASGDDAAVTQPGGVTATSVDAFVEGVHFRRETASLELIGRKAIAAALSDLAAMGATAGETYVQLGIPDDLDEPGCLALGSGLADAAAEYGVSVLGGDVTRAPALFLGLTVVGHAGSASDLVSRSGARPGDVLVVTGQLGGAAAGLLLLERPELGKSVPAGVARALRRRQLDPVPRLAAGRELAGHGASAMIDVSDGLGADAGHLAASSDVGVSIDSARLPQAEGVAEVAAAAGVDAADLVTASGEDYELLTALPPERLAAAVSAVQATGTSLTEIGAVTSGSGVAIRAPDGSVREASGFDQLRR